MDKQFHDVETNYGKYFKLPNPALRSYLGLVEKGNDEEYRTPFYKGKALTSIVNDWLNHLEKLQDKWPGLWKFENDLAKKVGPMSIRDPLIDIVPNIDSYYSDILVTGTPIDPAAISAVVKEWANFSGIRLRSQEYTLDEMKKSTSSGSPYYRKRRDVVEETFPCQVSLMKDGTVMQILPTGTWHAAAVLGWRGQEGGPETTDVKQRVVWMFPFAVNICELQCYQPLIKAAQQGNLVPAWVSMEAVDEAVTKLFDTKADNDLILCTDFEKFDQHFNSFLQDAAHDILGKLLVQDEQSKRWLHDVFPIKYNIPITYRWGHMRFGSHGMGSGSGGTNADETLAHRALQHEAAMSCSSILNPNSMCLGDDGILTYPGLRVEDVIDSYSKHGLVMNPDKQEESTLECTYLRRWHHRDYRVDGKCVGVYSTCRALGRLAEQERYYDPNIWGPKAVALRQLSILENCKFHPLREEFVEYCMKGDKYRLGIDIPHFLDDIQSIAKEMIDYMPDFLGYTKSMQKGLNPAQGISNWWIVQYLKSKA